MLKPLAFALIVVALHLGVATMAASRHVLSDLGSVPFSACDGAR